jgi:NAD(P)-dependent dehydrogenase (short-subunit alcohol dehydrogenase family)
LLQRGETFIDPTYASEMDVRPLIALAAGQQRLFAHWQLAALGLPGSVVTHRLRTGQIVRVLDGVYALAPSRPSAQRDRMAATLTAPDTFSTHASAGAAWGFREHRGAFQIVTRPGSGGPRMVGGVLVCRSSTLTGHTTVLDGMPITTPARTLVDLAPHIDDRDLARSLRELLRLELAGPAAILIAARLRRGAARIRHAVGRHAGLSLDRARSDAEALALVRLHEAARPMPDVNRHIAGEEADLSWPGRRLIVELDGPQFIATAERTRGSRRSGATPVGASRGWGRSPCTSDRRSCSPSARGPRSNSRWEPGAAGPSVAGMPTAIVTGASRGLGLALAGALAQRGWKLIVDARDGVALERAAAGLRAHSEVVAIAGDVADPAHREALVAAAGDVDALVNNASVLGVSPLPPLARYPLGELEHVLHVNALAPLALMQLALPRLAEGARIVNVTSDAAVEPYEGWGGYGAAKAALEQITAVFAAENPALRVYAVDPGDMNTRMHQDAYPGEDISDRPPPEQSVPGLLALIEGDLPSGRYAAAALAGAGEARA